MNLLNIFIPHSCTLCGKIFTQLCDTCYDTLDLCTGLETKLYYPNLPVQTVCRFDPASQRIIHNYKYKQYWSLATLIGTLMYYHCNLPKVDYITWVPSNAKRISERGFDHMLKVASVVSKLSGIPSVPLLIKKIHTPHQATQQKKSARNEHLNTVFEYRFVEGVSPNKKVLLLDDVLTTGATLSHCIDVLKQNGHAVEATVFCARI